jgi:hypothetical protein
MDRFIGMIFWRGWEDDDGIGNSPLGGSFEAREN